MNISTRGVIWLLVIFASACVVPARRTAPPLQSRLNPLPIDLPALIFAAATEAKLSVRWRNETQSRQGDFDTLLAKIDEGWYTNRVLDYALDLCFLVQNQYPGQRYGLPREKWLSAEYMWKNRMFVTEPIVSFRNRSIVVISQFSPCLTWIFAVDTNLVPLLIFDNYNKRETPPLTIETHLLEDSFTSRMYISIVQEVVYEREGKYKLVEYNVRSHRSQEIELTAKNDHLSLVEISEGGMVGELGSPIKE